MSGGEKMKERRKKDGLIDLLNWITKRKGLVVLIIIILFFLMNEINPGAVDDTTQDQLRNLRSVIKRFLECSH